MPRRKSFVAAGLAFSACLALNGSAQAQGLPDMIRRAKELEAGALSALAMAAKAHWPYAPAQLEAWWDDLTIPAELIASSPTWVAELDGEIAGFYSLLHEGEAWILEHLWVSPDRMRRGVGRALLSHALDFAARNGAADVAIDADPYAEPFYLACGARRVGAVAAPISDSQRYPVPA